MYYVNFLTLVEKEMGLWVENWIKKHRNPPLNPEDCGVRGVEVMA